MILGMRVAYELATIAITKCSPMINPTYRLSKLVTIEASNFYSTIPASDPQEKDQSSRAILTREVIVMPHEHGPKIHPSRLDR